MRMNKISTCIYSCIYSVYLPKLRPAFFQGVPDDDKNGELMRLIREESARSGYSKTSLVHWIGLLHPQATPAGPFAPGPSTLSAPGPSTLSAPGPSTLVAPGPSTLVAPGPSTLSAPGPSTLSAPGPSTLSAPGPFTLPVQGPVVPGQSPADVCRFFFIITFSINTYQYYYQTDLSRLTRRLVSLQIL
jgi:hypothetical protein